MDYEVGFGKVGALVIAVLIPVQEELEEEGHREHDSIDLIDRIKGLELIIICAEAEAHCSVEVGYDKCLDLGNPMPTNFLKKM